MGSEHRRWYNPLNPNRVTDVRIHSTPFILRPSAFNAKSFLPPDPYSSTTGPSGHFSEGFSLRREHLKDVVCVRLSGECRVKVHEQSRQRAHDVLPVLREALAALQEQNLSDTALASDAAAA